MYQTIKIVDIVEKEYFISTIRTIRNQQLKQLESTIRTIRINNKNNFRVIVEKNVIVYYCIKIIVSFI